MNSRRLVVAIALFLAGVSPARTARGAAPAEEARAAYERGTRAFQARDFAVAAREFARADAIVPSDAAIEAALETSLRAGDPVLGMELVDRARSRSLDPRAERATTRVAAAFASRVGRLIFPCEGATTCRAFVDGVEVERPRSPVVVMPGPHSARVVRDDRVREIRADVAAGASVSIAAPDDDHDSAGLGSVAPTKADAHDSAAAGAPRTGGRVSTRATTLGAIGTGSLTVLLGGASALSWIDLRSKRANFDDGACGVEASPTATPLPDCASRARSGRAAEVRTAIFVSATAVAAAATAAILIFRPWDRAASVNASVSVAPDLVALSVQGPLP